MRERPYNRWTPERLAHCQRLYEEGATREEIGRVFDIAPATVSVMAWQKKWQRLVKPTRSQSARVQAALQSAGDGAEEDRAPQVEEASDDERAFNGRLRQTIREYWQARGRRIWLSTEPQPGGVLGIRSKSVNGVPVSSQ